MSYGSPLQQWLYYRSPAFIKNAFATLYGQIQRTQRCGSHYAEALGQLLRTQYESNEALFEWQVARLRTFLTAARDHSPFYREQFRACHFDPESLHERDLTALPLLTKDTLREEMTRIIADDIEKRSVRWSCTSGTTGKALQFPRGISARVCVSDAPLSLGGVDLRRRERIAFCAGHPVAHYSRAKPPFWAYDAANRWLLMSSYHLSEQNVRFYVEKLVDFQPKMVAGYPSSVYLLALAVDRFAPGRVRPRAVFCASETFFDFQRAAIESAFGCKAFMWYGNSEMAANIVECEKGRKHLKLEHSYVEILNERNEPAKPGEEGRLVCTAFYNDAMPLIRYDIGDVVTLSEESSCPCGRSGILIEQVVGRREDYVITPDGRFVGRLDHLFKDATRVREAQIQQDVVDEVILRLVPTEGYTSADENAILEEARVRLGPDIHIRFEYVNALPRTANGKTRFIISNVGVKRFLGEEIAPPEFE